jgi:hypothetical protein
VNELPTDPERGRRVVGGEKGRNDDNARAGLAADGFVAVVVVNALTFSAKEKLSVGCDTE